MMLSGRILSTQWGRSDAESRVCSPFPVTVAVFYSMEIKDEHILGVTERLGFDERFILYNTLHT